jgi:Flp pilus assembly protein TadG
MTGMKRHPSRLRRFIKNIKGATAVEFAIVLPIFLSFVLGTFEVAHAVYSQGVMRFAIQEIARTIMVDSGLSPSDVEIAVNAKLSGLNVADIVDITATQVDNKDTTETLTLFVSYKYDFEVPLVATIPLVFDSKTSVIREIAS